MKALVYAKAVSAFARELFRPKARAVRHTPEGHSVLAGWEVSPESDVLRAVAFMESKKRPASRLSLFCYEGPHQGEMFQLSEGVELLSKLSGSSVVLTPTDMRKNDVYRMKINGCISLKGEAGAQFRLNGSACEEAELLDYDEIELLGNKFVVLLSDGAELGFDTNELEAQ